MAKNWIQKAVPPERRGVFSSKAQKAGMSTAEYARSVLKEGSKASTTTKRESNLAQTLGKLRKG